jgi:hypothetical protein
MTLLVHASYIAWSSKAVRQANEAWRTRRPYVGETIMTRSGLNLHLFRWAIENKLIADPGPRLSKPHSIYVAVVFEKDPEAVKSEARNYWKVLVDQHA